jgi:putative acetyltransferase
MRVRNFRIADAAALAQLFYDAVHQIAAVHYTEDQVRAWAPEVPDSPRIEGWATDGRVLLVAVDEGDQPVAFGDLEADGHIDHLYCRPDFAGSGVTSTLYERLECKAKEVGIKLLYVEASEPAQRFFMRRGFQVVERRDFEIKGVPIHNYRMEKPIQGDD